MSPRSGSGGRPEGLVQRVPSDRAVIGHRGFVADEPEQQRAIAFLAGRVEARSNVISPSVRVPVLSVKRISMLPRSSMATSRFTSTFFAASAFDPDERLTVTMAGIISGAIPTAIAREKRSASMSGLESATLTMKMNAVRTAATPKRNREKRDSPTSKAVWP